LGAVVSLLKGEVMHTLNTPEAYCLGPEMKQAASRPKKFCNASLFLHLQLSLETGGKISK
jgi:hypothetical protein